MLNIFKLNLNKYKSKTKIKNKQDKIINYYPSPVRVWNNSIYVFNKNVIKLIPVASKLTLNLIKSYFNLYNYKLERKIRERKLIHRHRILSTNKMFISNIELKHTNNKVIITLYMFNKQRYNYLNILKKRFKKIRKLIINRLNFIKYKNMQLLLRANKNKNLIIKTLHKYNFKNKNIISHKYLSEYITKFYKKLVNKSIIKFKLFLYYKQILLINQLKLSYTYLQYIKKYLEKIYNKNVVFNIIKLKYFYLSSDILSELILLKIRKDRRQIVKVLKLLKKNINIKKNYNLNDTILTKSNSTKVRQTNRNSLQKTILNNIKNKHISGFRLEATGRLTKRHTASRSITKYIYKGSLLDINSSYKGLSSVYLRGNLKTNIQFTKLKSKTRIGAFGIKGWVSGN